MRRTTALVLSAGLGVVTLLPLQASAAVGGCGGGEDYNGDGFADLAIGVPGENIGGAGFAGAIHVIYGDSGGLSSAGDQVFHQDTPGLNDTAEQDDEFGSSLASGDFDGDGFDDLVVGVPREDVGGDDEGAVHVIYGSASGLTSSGDQVFHRGSADLEDDPGEDDNFGASLAACDFDGDGRADLAVGVPGDQTRAGSVHVLYGGGGGLAADRDQVFSQDSPGMNDTAEANDSFGRSLAAGDFDGNGFGDLGVGVATENIGTVSAAGAIHVVYGGSDGLSSAGDQVFHQDSPGLNDTAGFADAFGRALTSGDFDGDGFGDLAIGVPLEDVGPAGNSGSIHVMYGASGGLSSSGDQVFHQDSDGMNDTAESFDEFGSALGSGDFDADGFDDVAVGLPSEGAGGSGTDAKGYIHIVYGTANGLSSAGDQIFYQDTPGMNDTAEDGDEFGRALTSGDFDADGFDDLGVGVPIESVGTGHGAVQVIYGLSGGLSSRGDQVFHQDSPGMNDVAEGPDRFGAALVGSPFF